MKIETYLKRQIALIDKAPAQFYGRVRTQQYRLLNEALDLVRDLELDGGKIIMNTRNLNTVNAIQTRLRQTFYNEDYVKAVRDLTEGFDKSAELSEKWLSGALGTEIGVDILEPARNMMDRQKRNATELLIGESAIESSFFKPVEQNLLDAVGSQSTMKELAANLRETIVGSEKVDGKLLRYSKQIAADAVATGDRNYMDNLAKGMSVEFYQYVGGILTDTRQFCETRNGNYYHRKEVELWGVTPENWQGRFRGTNPATIFTWCGGYNCKHSLVPVSEAVVPKDVLQKAIEKGYYQPSKAVQKELGLDKEAKKEKKVKNRNISEDPTTQTKLEFSRDITTKDDPNFGKTLNKNFNELNIKNRDYTNLTVIDPSTKTGKDPVLYYQKFGKDFGLPDRYNPQYVTQYGKSADEARTDLLEFWRASQNGNRGVMNEIVKRYNTNPELLDAFKVDFVDYRKNWNRWISDNKIPKYIPWGTGGWHNYTTNTFGIRGSEDWGVGLLEIKDIKEVLATRPKRIKFGGGKWSITEYVKEPFRAGLRKAENVAFQSLTPEQNTAIARKTAFMDQTITQIHETGHYIAGGMEDDIKAIGDANRISWKADAVSKYAKTNDREFWAESYTAYMIDPEGLRQSKSRTFEYVEQVLNFIRNNGTKLQ